MARVGGGVGTLKEHQRHSNNQERGEKMRGRADEVVEQFMERSWNRLAHQGRTGRLEKPGRWGFRQTRHGLENQDLGVQISWGGLKNWALHRHREGPGGWPEQPAGEGGSEK